MASVHPLSSPILAALSKVQDPDLKKDLVSLGMIQDLEISNEGKVSFRLVLTTPACPVKENLKQLCTQAVEALPGVLSVQVILDAKVQASHQRSGGLSQVAATIAVSSGKGGVGKSTIAVNLAVGLAREGARVGLLDSDLYGPNIPTMMGLSQEPEILPGTPERFIPPMAHGVKVMSMGLLLAPGQPVVWRGPMLHKLLQQFCHQVAWGELDYLILDMPPGTGDVQISLAQLIPLTGAILVTTSQEVSLQDVRKAMHMFDKVRVPLLGLVENMSTFECHQCGTAHSLFGEGGGAVLAKEWNLPCLASFPLMSDVAQRADLGIPAVLLGDREDSSALQKRYSAQYQEMARRVAQLVSMKMADQIIQRPNLSL